MMTHTGNQTSQNIEARCSAQQGETLQISFFSDESPLQLNSADEKGEK